MFVNKKHTGGDNFSYRDFFHSCVMHVSRVCLRIGLFLVALILICTLLGIRAFSGLMASLVANEAWQIVFGPVELPWPMLPLGRAMVNALRNTF